MCVYLFNLNLSQGGEEDEEEEVEHGSDEGTARPAAEQKAAVNAPTDGLGEEVEGEEEEEEEEERQIKEVKADEKGNLAGERQSGDGQVWYKKQKKRICFVHSKHWPLSDHFPYLFIIALSKLLLLLDNFLWNCYFVKNCPLNRRARMILRIRRVVKPVRSWMMTRTGRIQRTSLGRACFLSMM